ncbi:MAG TPA: gamma-glutamylcyclotransferase family protein [Gemmatimonadota bacterium]|nr:gamma-glutamylcyclotransferase family protein [Gemmatimonadota bacterium]
MTDPVAEELPLFVYGTLLDPTFTGRLLDHPVTTVEARLPDFEILRLEGLPFPALFEAPGEIVEGRLYRRLAAEDYVRLDAYEGVSEGLYRRGEVEVVAGPREEKRGTEPAHVYLLTEKTLRNHGIVE